MTASEQSRAAGDFAKRWEGRGYEKGETHQFWCELLSDVFGAPIGAEDLIFERHVSSGFIDVLIPSTRVLVEQKSFDVSLDAAVHEVKGQMLTPYEQARTYDNELSWNEKSRWIVTCNFQEFRIYDMNKPHDVPEIVLLKDFQKQFIRLAFLSSSVGEFHIASEKQLSIDAGNLVGKLYDILLPKYENPEDPDTLKNLNKLCVRIVFCLYAEDAGLFGKANMFYDYLHSFNGADHTRKGLAELFKILDMTTEQRKEYDPYMDDALAAFPYVNGGLFKGACIIPPMTDDVINLIENEMSNGFDWSGISPTIFGAVFESTLNPETRRSGGMHYTSVENIHKVIDPLFLDDLKKELSDIESEKVIKTRRTRLAAFQDKLANLNFLDPACGSGNFLTETYCSLRRLENQIIRDYYGTDRQFGLDFSPIKISITQFYGIEINDFAVSVAQTALWIAESQMQKETESIIERDLQFFPLTTLPGIVEGDALKIDWNTIVPKEQLSYIMGNPPFYGARLMTKEQKDSLMEVFGKDWHNVGNLDYVCAWYKKTADLISGTDIKAALVSTNSIVQGEIPAILWKPLFSNGIHFDFAYRTFIWDSEANIKAHVHCVIIGFSSSLKDSNRIIYDGDKTYKANNINGYLIDADDIFVESRNRPLCDVPEIGIGNKPIDDGNYLFTKEEMDDFIKKEPKSAQYFKPFYGSEEFINRKSRYCLWLGDCAPTELLSMPLCLQRIDNVKKFRLLSKSEGTRQLANRPTRFHVENMPNSNYIAIPETSSERRHYVPMGFLEPQNLCSNAMRLIPKATIYHFGILTSSVHMAWMRVVCGRLKSDYRYSKDIVYNNFPWPSPKEEQKAKIEKTAQAILDARALYPNCSLADLYDDLTMPVELRKAHQENDKAVMEAYGFPTTYTESDIVAILMKMYQKLTNN
jgi:type I restriction-modification system DNA methylase subunit